MTENQPPALTSVITPDHTVAAFTREFLRELNFGQGVTLDRSTVNDRYLALARAVRHYLMSRWIETLTRQRSTQSKSVCYLSAEYLLGKQLGNALLATDLTAIAWAIATMLGVILLYDQLLFRPLVAWSQRFRAGEEDETPRPRPWMLKVLQRSSLIDLATRPVLAGFEASLRWTRLAAEKQVASPEADRPKPIGDRLWNAGLVIVGLAGAAFFALHVHRAFPNRDIAAAFLLGLPNVPPDLARQLRSMQDWTTTLPIPVPVDRATWQETTIAGAPAYILNDNTGLGSGVIWQRDGRIIGVAGPMKATELRRIAESLK